jgi:hypothetical protein
MRMETMRLKVKTDRFNLLFLLVFGAFFVFLGLMTKAGFYAMGLTYILWSLAYTKCKAYAKYVVAMLLIFGATISILGWFLLRLDARIFITRTGMGIFAGGIANLIVALMGGEHK